MALHNEIGHLGEQATCKYLLKQGYKIRATNWRLGNIEIDIIAENADYIVLVEVKTRTSTFANINPEQYVDERKRRFMTTAGNAYVKHNQITKNLRFDICGILYNADKNEVTEIHYFENAFAPKLRTIGNSTYNGEWKWHRRHKH